MRIAVPDLISNSYFPAVAAVELGFFKAEGLDVELELVFPVPKTMEDLRDGKVDFVAGAAHATSSPPCSARNCGLRSRSTACSAAFFATRSRSTACSRSAACSAC